MQPLVPLSAAGSFSCPYCSMTSDSRRSVVQHFGSCAKVQNMPSEINTLNTALTTGQHEVASLNVNLATEQATVSRLKKSLQIAQDESALHRHAVATLREDLATANSAVDKHEQDLKIATKVQAALRDELRRERESVCRLQEELCGRVEVDSNKADPRLVEAEALACKLQDLLAEIANPGASVQPADSDAANPRDEDSPHGAANPPTKRPVLKSQH